VDAGAAGNAETAPSPAIGKNRAVSENGKAAPLLAERGLWDTVCVFSKDQPKIGDFSQLGVLFPRTEIFLCLYCHAARLKQMV
jgi:hypothetical protein